MKQIPIRLGPLALLLTVISICLTTLAILTFATARADMRLAEKYADTVHTRYELERQGQEMLAQTAETGTEDWKADENGILWKTLSQGEFLLRIGLSPEGQVVAWRQERQWSQDTSIGTLWPGN